MAAVLDIFAPQTSVIADGLEGKVILIYGSNSLGKTYQATKFPKPLVLACEYGMNGISDIPYLPITRWSDFKNAVSQLTGYTKDKARELYSTIIIDEVYASSIYCQDYICQTFGNGTLSLADSADSKHNLYKLYETEYFRQINALVNAGFTIVFIAHQQENSQTHFISPKGDKRCIDPIVDKCDYVVYLKSNGVDSDGNVIHSSGYLAQTEHFFARSRIEYTPTYIKDFTAANLEAAIREGIRKKVELDGAKVVTFAEQQERNSVEELNFNKLVEEFNTLIANIPGSSDKTFETEEGKRFKNFWIPQITKITESYLGNGGKVSLCTETQVEAVSLIVKEVKNLINKNM